MYHVTGFHLRFTFNALTLSLKVYKSIHCQPRGIAETYLNQLGGLMRKIAFLDRDGTIIKDYPDEDWRHITEPEFLEDSFEGMKALRDLGYEFIVVTNQYTIADGVITLEDYERFQEKFLAELRNHGIEVLKTYYCPHNDAMGCSCKKPLPGMIEQAMDEFDIDLSHSICCGNTDSDFYLAKHFSLPFYGVQFEGNAEAPSFSSLLEVANALSR